MLPRSLMLLWLMALHGTGAFAAPPQPVTAVAAHAPSRQFAAASQGTLYLMQEQGDVVEVARYLEPKATAIAFRPDGKQLALATGAAGQRGVVQFYSLPQLQLTSTMKLHRDLIHALVYSPDGKTLATSSYDRAINLIDVATSKTLKVFTEHSDAVYGLAWKPDGSRLASVSADRTVKLWEPASGKKILTLSDATDWLYAVAWSADGKRLVAGGVDKSLRLWNLEGDAGTLVKAAFAHEKGIVALQYQDGTLYSLGEEGIVKAWDAEKLMEKKSYQQPGQMTTCMVVLLGKLIVGAFDGTLKLVDVASGKPLAQPLPETFPWLKVEMPALQRPGASLIKLPATLAGVVTQAGQAHHFRIDLKPGEELGVALQKVAGSKLDAFLELYDAQGKLLDSGNDQLGYRSPRAEPCFLSIRDRDFRGSAGQSYRLKLGPLPIITSHFPLSVPAGVESNVTVQGVHLQGVKSVAVKPDVRPGIFEYTMPLPWPSATQRPTLPEIQVTTAPLKRVEALSSGRLSIPSIAIAQLDTPGEEHAWRFVARRGQRLALEVFASRLGSDLDSVMEIQDAAGKPVERAILSPLARTYITLRDRDANDAGLRLENWSGFALNDYLYAGTELLRLRDLPKGPDEDCKFWASDGKRRGYLGTTPRAQPLGGSIYQVTLHPPGTLLPRTGYPAFHLYERNDDGGPGFGKDSYLLFDPPADGEYRVVISDAERRGGPRYSYSLALREARPGFSFDVQPRAAKLRPHAAQAITVTVKRQDGFLGPVDLHLEGVDAKILAQAGRVLEEEESAIIVLEPVADAAPGAALQPFKVIASSTIAEKKVVQEAMSQAPQIVPPGDLVTTTESPTVVLKPGGSTQVTVRIERRNNFKGRVPLEVKGLPFGVQVTDVGLNGILITEADSGRTFTLKAEPWVKPQATPLVVVAKREGQNAEYGTRTMVLKISP